MDLLGRLGPRTLVAKRKRDKMNAKLQLRPGPRRIFYFWQSSIPTTSRQYAVWPRFSQTLEPSIPQAG